MQSRREPVPPSMRMKVLIRDGFKCIYCGATQKDAKIEIDHVIPVSAGGTSDIGNLAAACFECNRGKGDKLVVDITEGDIGVCVNPNAVVTQAIALERPTTLAEVPEAAWAASARCESLLSAWDAALRTRWQSVQALPQAIEIESVGERFEFYPSFICSGRESCDIGPEVRVLVVEWQHIGRFTIEEMMQIRNAVISGYDVPTMILMGPPEFFYGVCVNERYKGTPLGFVLDDHLQPIEEWHNTGWYPDECLDFYDLREPFFSSPQLFTRRSWDDCGNLVGVYSSFFEMEARSHGV